MNCLFESSLTQVLLARRGEWTQPFFHRSSFIRVEELNDVVWSGEHDREPFDTGTPIELSVGGDGTGVLCFDVAE